MILLLPTFMARVKVLNIKLLGICVAAAEKLMYYSRKVDVLQHKS